MNIDTYNVKLYVDSSPGWMQDFDRGGGNVVCVCVCVCLVSLKQDFHYIIGLLT